MTTTAVPKRQSPLTRGTTPFILRRLHSLTGIVFGLYVLVHLFINATLIQGMSEDGRRTVYQVQVDKIHSLPFLLLVEWVLIYLPIIYHSVYGLWLTYAAQPNVSQYPFAKNAFYTFQRLTGLVLVFFIIFHVAAMKGWFGATLGFDPREATVSAVRHLNANWFLGWIVYPVAVLCAAFHLANGFWTAAISWGVTISAASQKRFGWVCGGIFVFAAVCGFVALYAALVASGGRP